MGIGWLAIRGTPFSWAVEFTVDSYRLERIQGVAVHIPNPVIEKVLEAITVAVPLTTASVICSPLSMPPGWNNFAPAKGFFLKGGKTRLAAAR